MKPFFQALFLIGIFGFFLNSTVQAQPAATEKPARILFLVDGSSSMLENWQGTENRFSAASRIINALIDSVYAVNSEVAFGVRTFGTQYPAQEKNCFDSRLEVSFAYQNASQIEARLRYIRPLGYSPIAWSLKQAAEKDFVRSDEYAYSIILITDGGESCGGDICATVQNLLAKKISFKPYILSLVDYEPLKLEYDCLGNYLKVSKESEIKPAIQKIVADNKKVFSVKTIGLAPIPRTKTPIAETPPVQPKKIVATPPIPKVIPKVIPIPEPKAKEPEPVAEVPKVEPKPIARAKVPVIYLNSITKPRKFNLLYALDEAKPVSVPKFSPIKVIIEDDPPVKTTVRITENKPRANSNPVKASALKPSKPVKLEIKTQTEDADETKLQIFFTNGKGKFYTTEPNIELKNLKTNTTKSLYRLVEGGAPALIKLEAGNYDITIPGSKATALNVPIVANKNNKVVITVGTGSIGFIHPTAPNKPVEGYEALISKRFVKNSPVIKQSCAEVLPYETDNYHIEINTLPPLIYNLYVDFDQLKVVAVPEPGIIQIANTQKLGRVQFWYQLGDQFVPFLDMEVNGDLSKQKRDFLPGKYQVRYYKLPVKPYQKAEMVPFSIERNKTTTITLAL